ncbi:MAG: cellulase family glycosylhydrolase [Defluviitaleaceae bacterium]|nr:cellulase family glycosylhydrolase [Defluviitaleaceae bacterium]
MKKLAKVLVFILVVGLIPAMPVNALEITMSSHEFAASLGPGWNMGNQFDAHSGRDSTGFHWLGGGNYDDSTVTQLETAWVHGSVATQTLIQNVHDSGFRAIRIPVSWNKVAPAPDRTIRPEWMARVREVVEWAYDLDMHVILNSHHDEVTFDFLDSTIENEIAILTRWWEQIAEEFNGFSERLVFAGLNEPRGQQNMWTGGIPETRANINRLNQAFVDTVRASGGNNAERFLIVPTHAASSTPVALNGFVIPNDSANDRILMAVHTYSPFAWAHDGRGTYDGPASIRTDLERVASHSERLGIPVILSEWGSINNGNPENLAQREQHAYDYVSIARSLGMPVFWWDNGQPETAWDAFGLFNRRTGDVVFPTIIDSIMRASGITPTAAPAPAPVPGIPESESDSDSESDTVLTPPVTGTPDGLRLRIQMDSYNIVNIADNSVAETMDVLPMIVDGRTLIPVRFIANALGADVLWDEDEQRVTLESEDNSLSFVIGEAAQGMDVPAQIIDGRTMVPIRFVGEFFGALFTWDEATATIEFII